MVVVDLQKAGLAGSLWLAHSEAPPQGPHPAEALEAAACEALPDHVLSHLGPFRLQGSLACCLAGCSGGVCLRGGGGGGGDGGGGVWWWCLLHHLIVVSTDFAGEAGCRIRPVVFVVLFVVFVCCCNCFVCFVIILLACYFLFLYFVLASARGSVQPFPAVILL